MPTNANSVSQIRYHNADGSYSETISYIPRDPFLDRLSPYKCLAFPTSDTITLAQRTVNFSPNTLGNTTHVYSSPQEADIINLADYFADWGCSYTIQEGAVHNITVQAPWDTFTSEDWWISSFASEQWEIIPQQGTKSLVYNGLLPDAFAYNGYVKLPPELTAAVLYAKNNDLSNITLNAGQTSALSPARKAVLEPLVPLANKILSYMKLGIEGVPSYTQILKRTAVIDKNNVNNAFFTAADEIQAQHNRQGSVNFMASTPDMLKLYNIPNATVGRFMLPSYQKPIVIYDVGGTTSVATYAGWLIKPPTLQFIGSNKIQITQEFVWDEYIAGMYYIHSDVSDFPTV